MIGGMVRREDDLYIVRPRPDIVEYADNVAAVRQGMAFLKGRNSKGLIGSFDKFLAYNRMGACCEAAGKILLNPIRWHALAEKITHLPDLGGFIDVKGRARTHYDLPVQKDDEDEFAFLLITAEKPPDYVVHGWLWGWEAKSPQYWSDPERSGRAAYFVPQKFLRPTDELIALLHPKKKSDAA